MVFDFANLDLHETVHVLYIHHPSSDVEAVSLPRLL